MAAITHRFEREIVPCCKAKVSQARFGASTPDAAVMCLQLKVKKAREFLQKGNRVRVMVAFPGRRGFEDAKSMLATLVEQASHGLNPGAQKYTR